MKKILTALLLFTDLYGMTPRYFVDTKNPKEDQVAIMHSDFLQNIGLSVISFDEYKAYTGEFEYIKNALLDNYARFFKRGRRYLSAEVNAISRYPNAKERDAAQKFAKVLGLQDEDLQIKVIDAESYIQGIYLSEDRRNYFLDWLHKPNQAKDWMLFSEHLSKIHFPNKFYLASGETLKINGGEGQNEAFRKKVLKIIVDSSKASDIYRGLMICFFAKMEAIPSVCSRYAYKGFSNSILEGNTSCHCCEGISLSQEENGKLLYQTLVKSDQTVGPFPSGFSSFPLALPRTLFHECGHFLDFFSGAFEGYKSNKTVEEVVLKFFDFQTDKEAFKEHKSNLKKRMEKHPLALSSAQTLMKKNFGSIDDFIKYREDNLDNPIVQTKIFINANNGLAK